MDQRTIQILFALLRSAIRGTKMEEEEQSIYSSEMLFCLLKISSKHDVAHLLALGLKQNELIQEEHKDIEKQIIKSVYRYEKTRCDYEKICSVLENAGIPFLPLKGSVIREYYPEPWMRTSCDIDILIHKEDCEKAKSVLMSELSYSYSGKCSHDMSFYSPDKVHIELHYDLIEEGRVNYSSHVLKNSWDTATIRDGYSSWYEMSDEMFYFYHIAHMAKHFENGGCGIRPFIDLWILDNLGGADEKKRDELLNLGHLLKFANAVRKLSCVWFENEEYDLTSKEMENYILSGGVYGNDANRITFQQQQKGGKVKYALYKIFIPYSVIKYHYPILQKHRWLMPIMQVRRWYKLIFRGHLRRTTKELRYSNNISNEDAANMKIFLKNIGL